MSHRSIVVATWSLKVTDSKSEDVSIESTEPVVKTADVRRGKYRDIVRLSVRYETQSTSDPRSAPGTAWLIGPDLLISAGHSVYDHEYSFGKASQIKASIDSGSIRQVRYGRKILTTKKWIEGGSEKAYDVSLIRLDRSFDDTIVLDNGDERVAEGQKHDVFKDTVFDLKSDGVPGDYRKLLAQYINALEAPTSAGADERDVNLIHIDEKTGINVTAASTGIGPTQDAQVSTETTGDPNVAMENSVLSRAIPFLEPLGGVVITAVEATLDMASKLINGKGNGNNEAGGDAKPGSTKASET